MGSPATVPVFAELQDDIDDVLAEHQNTPNDEIAALATMIGMFGAGKTQSYGTDLIAQLLSAATPLVTKASASSITISAGTLWIGNSAGSVRLPRKNLDAITLTAADLDTGAMAVGFYYIYAVADAVSNGFTGKISASATTPTGLTNYRLIGWFYNETGSVLDITTGNIGNVRVRECRQTTR